MCLVAAYFRNSITDGCATPVFTEKLTVAVPPMISVQNQLVGASVGSDVTLDCHSEAYPKSINYWTFKNVIIAKSKYYRKDGTETTVC